MSKPAKPAAPTLTSTASTELSASWPAPSPDVTAVSVKVKNRGEADWQELDASTGRTSDVVRGLAPGGVYACVIAMQNQHGWSDWSRWRWAVLGVSDVPAKPAPPTLTSTGNSEIAISWPAPSPAVTFVGVWVRERGEADWQGLDGSTDRLCTPGTGVAVAGDRTKAVVKELSQGVAYECCIAMANQHGWGKFSDIACAVLGESPAPEQPAAAPSPALDRHKRWGDGLEAPAAGSRCFFQPGYEVQFEVPEAIAQFGHSEAQVCTIMQNGHAKASTYPTPFAPAYAAALLAYTEESPLYGTLNYTMRTPHTHSAPTDTELNRYADYIIHLQNALGCLPPHVSELEGHIFRGVNILLNPEIYAPGKRITWQAFTSATRNQMVTLTFLHHLEGRRLRGSMFVMKSLNAKYIRHFSQFPQEEEVIFPPNSQFRVETVVANEAEKKATLDQLSAYDMQELDVYILRQVA